MSKFKRVLAALLLVVATLPFMAPPQEAQADWNGNPRYLTGYPDGSIRPDGPLTRAEYASMLYRLSHEPGYSSAIPWDARGHWAQNAIGWACERGYMRGFPDGSFKPDLALTRAEMAAIAVRYADYKYYGEQRALYDMTGHWAEKDMKIALSKGIVFGYPDGAFYPNRNATRAETAFALSQIFERPVGVGQTVGTAPSVPVPYDLPRNHWAYYVILDAMRLSVV